ncbi:uncharacterized protein TM35_000132900 [Trypanosoma theileri]|uniref:Uncharacterized protein n=1 Tax=Trypanosoma theileri TaxID=67003 RepID=A0A1X0NX50_9TRYP|nr:uncharacterized protein TM35_000132900 [Trypanosoma theileri]ORC89286.1 hypothetical protein TM35_000132900 [Trypanosoma theileri]
MDALRELSTVALDTLKHEFFLYQGSEGLDEEGFIDVITRVCMEHNTSTIPTDVQIRKFFAAVDVFGVGRISWNAFLRHAVDFLRHRLYGVAGEKQQEEILFRPFHIRQVLKNGHGSQVSSIRVLPKNKRVIKVVTENSGLSTVHMCDPRQNLLSVAAIKRFPCSLLAWDYVPLVREIPFSNSIVCTYNDSYLRFFSLKKKRYDGILENCHSMRMSETQSVLHWVSSCNLLAMGSRTGMVSLCDLERQVYVVQKRLFQTAVTAMRTYKKYLYIASLDTQNAVKCFDIEHGVVQFSLNDHDSGNGHDSGGALILECDDHYLYSSGFGRSIVQRSLVVPRTPPVHFCDHVQPHRGRITVLHRLHGLPLLVSGDTRGTLKFWDLRMGYCVQTIHGSGNMNALSTVNLDDGLPELEPGLSAYRAAHVNSICHLDMVGKLNIATSRELIVLSSDAFVRPELTDDRHSCRFLFFPNPDSIITVHDRCVKLWNSITGLLTDVTEPNIIKYDVSASCIVEPLNRQLLIGTIGGEVKALSVSMLQETINLTPALQMHLHGEEVINLHTVSKYRDISIPHVFVVTQYEIFMVPLKPDCGSQSVTHFHGILRSFMRQQQIIRATSVTETRLLLATSDACVHVVEYQGLVTHTHTFSLSAEVETIIARTVIVTTNNGHDEDLNNNTPISSVGNEVAFFSDVTGRVHIVLMHRSSPIHGERPFEDLLRRRSKEAMYTSCEEIGSWCPRKPHSWIMAQGRAKVQRGTGEYCRRPRTRSTSLDFLFPGDEPHQHHHSHSHHSHRHHHYHNHPLQQHSYGEEVQKEKKEDPNHVMPFTDTDDALSLQTAPSNAVLIAYFDRQQVLVTADDTGEICLWDVSGILALLSPHPTPTNHTNHTNINNINTTITTTISTNPLVDVEFCGGRRLPLRITAWRCPGCEVVRLAAAEHPELRLPLLIAAMADRRVMLWSSDGAPLGVLAAGRSLNAENTAAMRRSGVQPYRLMCGESTTVAQWATFIDYMQKKKEQLQEEEQQLKQQQQEGEGEGQEQGEQGQRLQMRGGDGLMYCSLPRCRRYSRQTSLLQLKAKERRDESRLSTGTGNASGNSVIPRLKTPHMSFALPQCPTVSMYTTKHLSHDGLRNGSNVTAENVSENVYDKDTEELMSEYEQPYVRGGNSIVKPMHQRLVTRRMAPCSLERTGVVGLPPLFSRKQQQPQQQQQQRRRKQEQYDLSYRR